MLEQWPNSLQDKILHSVLIWNPGTPDPQFQKKKTKPSLCIKRKHSSVGQILPASLSSSTQAGWLVCG